MEFRMSTIERRYERAFAALKAIARSIGNMAFRVEDYRPPQGKNARAGHGDRGNEPRGEAEKPVLETRCAKKIVSSLLYW
jgi:hypothetical protein